MVIDTGSTYPNELKPRRAQWNDVMKAIFVDEIQTLLCPNQV
jgi:hypothetical protein